MLKLKNVSKYYYQDGVIAAGFTKVNLELHLGEFVVITGESGSGKSTLLNVLSGLDTYEDGEMYINGEETSHYTEEDYLEYRRKYVSNIFQNFNLVNSYTVYENIELAMLLNGKKKREVKKYINELIDKVGLKKYKNTLASKLSGGQKQRVAIARALANDTPIIVADEPTGSLDSKAAGSILKLLHEISQDKLVIVVTHNKAEIEEYATHLIRMHDGKILENKIVKEINLDSEITAKEVKNISNLNKIRLGLRNAFNIPIKFLLMVIIFALIIITLGTFYGATEMAKNEEVEYAYNYYFQNTSDKRIIISKSDHLVISDADYEKISKLDGIDYIVKNDLLNDYNLNMYSDNFYLNGSIRNDILKVDVGKKPSKKDEVVIIGNKDDWYLSSMQEDLLQDTYTYDDNYNGDKLKIVGIVYDDSLNYNYEFYLNDELKKDILTRMYTEMFDITIKLNNNYFGTDKTNYLKVLPSSVVKEGEAYIRDDANNYCDNYNCLNKNINVSVSNIYYEEDLDLKITNIYTYDNAKKLLNVDYNNSYDTVYISEEDYNKLYNKGNYQSSVFIKDVKDLNKINNNLQTLGYKTLSLRDSKANDLEMIMQIFKIFKLIMTLGFIFVLFFITYFIIKIIYKSRNSYYVTLRTLGSTKGVCVNILMNEIVTLASFTYLLFLIFISLIKKNIIKITYFQNISKYLGLSEYLIIYVILLVVSILIAYRYGRKIFKNSIIKNYGERI